MSVFVLVSTDSNLQAEVESCFGGFSPRPSLIHTGSSEEMEGVLNSVSEVNAVLWDSSSLTPPPKAAWPLLVIGDGLNTHYPTIQRPLYTETLSFVLDELIESASGSPETDPKELSPHYEFIQAFLKEVVHDLNNQFTTLRGNVPFLKEMYPQDDGTIQDIHLATERGAELLHLLEGLDADTRPDPAVFLYKELYREFSHFGKKMLPGCVFPEVAEPTAHTELRGDPLLCCTLLLKILWIYQSHSGEVLLEHKLEDESLSVRFSFLSALESSDLLHTQLERLMKSSGTGRTHLHLDREILICSFPRNLPL